MCALNLVCRLHLFVTLIFHWLQFIYCLDCRRIFHWVTKRLRMEDTSRAHLVSSSAQARSPTVACLGTCPGFWVFSSMETPQPLWVTCVGAWFPHGKKSHAQFVPTASVLFLPCITFSCLRDSNLCWRYILSCRDYWQLEWGKQCLQIELLRWTIGVTGLDWYQWKMGETGRLNLCSETFQELSGTFSSWSWVVFWRTEKPWNRSWTWRPPHDHDLTA